MRFTATDPEALVRLRSGVGAWVAVMHLDGHAAATYASTPSQFVSVIPHLDLGLRVALTSRLGLAANLSGGASIPGTSIRFADRQVATWGRPLWLVGVAVEAPLD
jgi:small ligand-binding sensory domain FIST